MDTKEAKKILYGYAGLKMEVENDLNRIRRAENDAMIPALKMGDGSKSTGGSGDRQENAVLRWMDVKERLMPSIEDKVARMRDIERAINSLSDSFERLVLMHRYIDVEGYYHPTWPEIAQAIYLTDEEKAVQAVTRLHGRALQSVAEALGKEESHL